jgi:hypothetical protein
VTHCFSSYFPEPRSPCSAIPHTPTVLLRAVRTPARISRPIAHGFSFLIPTLRTLRESVVFIGTWFSNLYTAVDTPAEAAWLCVWCLCVNMCPDVLVPLLRTSGYVFSSTSVFSLRLVPSPTRSRCNPNSFRLLRRSTSAPHPTPWAHLLHLPTSPRPSLCTSTMTT